MVAVLALRQPPQEPVALVAGVLVPQAQARGLTARLIRVAVLVEATTPLRERRAAAALSLFARSSVALLRVS